MSNDSPIFIKNLVELEALGVKLRRQALEEPLDIPPIYTKEEVASLLSDEKWCQSVRRRGGAIVIFPGHCVSIMLSWDTYIDPLHPANRWHVSICEQIPKPSEKYLVPSRVPDDPAKIISEAILGGPGEEITTTAKVILEIREFVREAK